MFTEVEPYIFSILLVVSQKTPITVEIDTTVYRLESIISKNSQNYKFDIRIIWFIEMACYQLISLVQYTSPNTNFD